MSLCCGEADSDSDSGKPRSCTDVFCLGIFILFWGLLIFVAAFAFVIGDPIRLAYGQDSFGNTCGKPNEELGNMTFSGMDMTDRPYLFFLNMSDLHQSLKICVRKCPSESLNRFQDLKEFERVHKTSLCRYDIANKSLLYYNRLNETMEKFFQENEGPSACPAFPVYATMPLLNRCVPMMAANATYAIVRSIYSYLNSFDLIQQVVSDIYAARYVILGMIFFAFVLSFIVSCTIHCLASVVSWIIMLVACIASIAGTGVMWWAYLDIKWELDSTPFDRLLSESAQNERTFLVYAIFATVFTIILLLIVLVMRKRVAILVKLFEEAGKCVRSMPKIFLQPFVTFVALMIFFAFWVGVLVCLATAYYPSKKQIGNPYKLASPTLPPLDMNISTAGLAPQFKNKVFTLVNFNQSSWVQYMWWYHIIALIWTSEFILGCQQMVIAGSVATWYFSRDRDQLRCPIWKAAYQLLVYHLGSVALGAFLITLFKVPRIFLTYVIAKMRKYEEYTCVSWCLKCCTCCLWCMEKCIRYLNHNAYTLIAIQGSNFCPAARDAFDILVSNALQVATINSVGDFILFLGKCGVTAITSFVGIILIKNDPELHFYAIPVLLIAVFSYFIAHCVLSVYEMVIDTLFLCTCEDLLKNDGSKEKPYFGGALVRFVKGNESGQPLQPLNKISGDTQEAE